MAEDRKALETGQRVIKSRLDQVVKGDGRELVVRNDELAKLIDTKFTEAAKSGIDPAALDVDITIRW